MADESQTAPNHMRRSTKWGYGLLGVGGGSVLAFVLQLNGLYFTRNEGLNVKTDVATLSTKLDTTNQTIVTAINGLRTDMNTGFSNLQIQLLNDKHAQGRIDEAQNLQISELKLFSPLRTPNQKQPKENKEN